MQEPAQPQAQARGSGDAAAAPSKTPPDAFHYFFGKKDGKDSKDVKDKKE